MIVRRPAVIALVGVCAACLLMVIATAFASGGGTQVAFEGDPFVVTPTQLKSGLSKAGLKVRYVKGAAGPATEVAGVAHLQDHLIGFEFQLFPASDEATVRYVGRLQAPDFGWPKNIYHGMKFKTWVRGVLGNVAFAEYERSPLRKHFTPAEARRSQLTYQSLRRRVDDALFRSFPENDPYVHATAVKPE